MSTQWAYKSGSLSNPPAKRHSKAFGWWADSGSTLFVDYLRYCIHSLCRPRRGLAFASFADCSMADSKKVAYIWQHLSVSRQKHCFQVVVVSLDYRDLSCMRVRIIDFFLAHHCFNLFIYFKISFQKSLNTLSCNFI